MEVLIIRAVAQVIGLEFEHSQSRKVMQVWKETGLMVGLTHSSFFSPSRMGERGPPCIGSLGGAGELEVGV